MNNKKSSLTKELTNHLDNAMRNEGWGRRDAFVKFLELSFLAQASPISKQYDIPRHERLEQRYREITDTFIKKSQTCESMALAFKALVDALEILGYCDLLGELWMEYGANKNHGQFFTPYPLCQMMTKMTCVNMDTNEEHTIQDPAAGFGATLIATAEHAKDCGVPQQSLHFETIDIDQVCYWGGFIQMNLLGMHAHVWWGDSLAMEMRDMQPTLMAVMFPHKSKTNVQADIPPKILTEPKVLEPAGQMTLF